MFGNVGAGRESEMAQHELLVGSREESRFVKYCVGHILKRTLSMGQMVFGLQ